MKKRRYVSARSMLMGLSLITCFSDCAILQRQPASYSCGEAFIRYWAPSKETKQLRLAVKDLIDIKGVVTTAGSEYVALNSPPATTDAACLTIAQARNVQIVGKTNLSEFAAAPSGINDFFGTPRSPLSKKSMLIPGGSSSGSAVAVANGLADVAFGTDTAGSIRVPAACCGIVGLKTTFGLVSLQGVFPIEPFHLDTVGPMAKDVDHVVKGMDLLQNGFVARYRAAVAAKPSAKGIRIGRLYLSGTDPKIDKAVDDALVQAQFQVVPLDQAFKEKWNQAEKDGNTLAAAGVWISDRKYFDKLVGVSARSKAIIAWGGFNFATNYQNALRRQAAWQQALYETFRRLTSLFYRLFRGCRPGFQ
jgi:amidase